MRSKSSVDWWMKLLVLLAIEFLVSCTFSASADNQPMIYWAVWVTTAFILWLYFGTYYEFKDTYLYIRSGPFLEKIPYNRIESIRFCKNRWSSMALSSHRIEIKQKDKGFVRGTTYISPVNLTAFYKELQKRIRESDLIHPTSQH